MINTGTPVEGGGEEVVSGERTRKVYDPYKAEFKLEQTIRYRKSAEDKEVTTKKLKERVFSRFHFTSEEGRERERAKARFKKRYEGVVKNAEEAGQKYDEACRAFSLASFEERDRLKKIYQKYQKEKARMDDESIDEQQGAMFVSGIAEEQPPLMVWGP